MFPIFSSIPNGFFEFIVLRVNEKNPRNLLALSIFGFFNCPFMSLPQLSISCHFRPEFWP